MSATSFSQLRTWSLQNESEKTIRAFIAVEAPPDVKARLSEIQSDFKRRIQGASWTRPEGFHLTLRFLGNIAPAQVAAVKDALAPDFKIPPFEAVFDHTGIFPKLEKARVLWVGLGDGEKELEAVFDELEGRLAVAGFPREERPFSGHLTLARFRNPRPVLPALLSTQFDCPAFTVDKITFFQSALNPAGAIYTPLAVSKLLACNT
jgi:RNA 2',3'-cyclic 3'-phosphodiesterase